MTTHPDFSTILQAILTGDTTLGRGLAYMLAKSDLGMRLAAQPETQALFKSVQELRAGVVRVMLEKKMITEEEAAPVREGGLGLVELLKRAKG